MKEIDFRLSDIDDSRRFVVQYCYAPGCWQTETEVLNYSAARNYFEALTFRDAVHTYYYKIMELELNEKAPAVFSKKTNADLYFEEMRKDPLHAANYKAAEVGEHIAVALRAARKESRTFTKETRESITNKAISDISNGGYDVLSIFTVHSS